MTPQAASDAASEVHDNRRGRVIAALLLAATVIGAYSGCLGQMVAHRDDYWLLWDPTTVLQVWESAGRWASGLIFQATWYGAESVHDLWRPRLAALTGIYLVSVGIYASLRQLHYSWLLAVGAASLAALLPTFNVYAVWATCAGHAYACLAAMCAFWLTEAAGRQEQTWRAGACGLAAAAVLYVGFSIYQPAAMFYVTMLVMAVAASEDGAWRQRQVLRWTSHAAVLGAALVASFLTFKLMAHDVQNVDVAARAELATDPLTKAGRFLLQPVGQSCLPYFFVNHWEKWQILAVACGTLGVFVPIGLWLRWDGSPSSRAGRIAVVLAMIPASYIPNLLVASDFFPYRTRAAISVAILFLLILAASGYVRWFVTSELGRRCVAGAGLACALGVALAMTRHHLNDCFFVPSRIEWDVVCTEVVKASTDGPSEPRRIAFLMPDSDMPVAKGLIYDEFGSLSAGCDWVTKGMTGVAVREVAPEALPAFRRAEFVNVPHQQTPPPLGPDDWEINARKLNADFQSRPR